jgi:hypothetical protein
MACLHLLIRHESFPPRRESLLTTRCDEPHVDLFFVTWEGEIVQELHGVFRWTCLFLPRNHATIGVSPQVYFSLKHGLLNDDILIYTSFL